ncbi:MAG: caspase family protein, partial [Candidatus Electrothrix sp. AUS1_2]|nr:caspase family protein [Candidatus Electrothrix sp. AUS1_2]
MNKKYAILIAGSTFPEEPGLTELRCPEHDVDALKGLLASPDFGQFTEVVDFKNRPSHEVLVGIENVLADAGGNDLVLVYFSGHGKTGLFGKLCFVTTNTRLKTLRSTSIPAETVKSLFDEYPVKKKVLILDCCYSGAVGKDLAKGGVDGQLELMAEEGRGTFIMTASTGIQVALEKEGDHDKGA